MSEHSRIVDEFFTSDRSQMKTEMIPTRYKKAVDFYRDSEGFQKSSDPITLGTTEAKRVYLENRILAAFREGWEAKERADDYDRNAEQGAK